MLETVALASLFSFAIGAGAALVFKARTSQPAKTSHAEMAVACADGGYYCKQVESKTEYFSRGIL